MPRGPKGEKRPADVVGAKRPPQLAASFIAASSKEAGTWRGVLACFNPQWSNLNFGVASFVTRATLTT